MAAPMWQEERPGWRRQRETSRNLWPAERV